MEKLPAETTENGIHYTLHGEYYVPNLTCPRDDHPVGKWGRMHLIYLKEHRPGQYSQMVLSGKLNSYLADLDEWVQARLDLIVRQMAAAEVVDEKLKAADEMEWVRRMNSIRHRAEEIVIAEMVME